LAYRVQNVVLSAKMCEDITKRYTNGIKQKARLARSVPDSLLTNHNIYGVKKVKDIQAIRSWRFIKNFRNMDEVLMKKHEEIGNKKKVKVEVITQKTGKKKGEKSYLSAIILDTEQKIKFKIENIVWPSEEKLALTSLAILIAICKEKATIKVNTNSEM
ncbi:1801_t:CDS:1, partial [Paraglomus brasilianum]